MELRQQRSLGAGKNHVESGNGHNPGGKKKKRKIQVHTVGAAHKVLEATRRAHNKSDVK